MKEFAGTLTQRVEIWQRSAARLDSGASTDDMALLANCLASVAADGAAAATEAMAFSAMPRFKIVIRAQTGIAVDQQVRWKGRKLLVRQILDDPQFPDRLTLRCEEQR